MTRTGTIGTPIRSTIRTAGRVGVGGGNKEQSNAPETANAARGEELVAVKGRGISRRGQEHHPNTHKLCIGAFCCGGTVP
ncbi:hypothetical protein ACHAXT_001622 [Thalassiosira profunda]